MVLELLEACEDCLGARDVAEGGKGEVVEGSGDTCERNIVEAKFDVCCKLERID